MTNDGINELMEYVMEQLGISQGSYGNGKNGKSCNNGKDGNGGNDNSGFKLNLPPQKLAVIAGLLTNVLEVKSVLIDRNQVIEIVVDGSLKRKTPLDKALDVIGPFPFDQVIRAISDRL